MIASFQCLVQTILWRNRFRIGCLLLGVCSMAALIHWQWHAARELSAISLVCSFYFLFGILCNTEGQAGTGFSGISSYFFRLPVRTGQILAAHLVVGLVLVLGVYGLWYFAVLRKLSQTILFGDLALFLVACFSVFSSAVWGLARVPRLRIVLLVLGFFLMLGLSLGPLGLGGEGSSWWTEDRFWILVLLAGCAMVAPLVSFPLIQRDRSGGYECPSVFSKLWWMRPTQWFSLCRSDSAMSMLVLSECRRSGWVLPLGIASIVGIVHSISLWRDFASGTIQNEFAAALANGLMVAGLWVGAFVQGLLISNNGPSVWGENRKMSSYFGVLPVGSNVMAFGKLAAAGFSLGLSWMILLGGVGAWHWFWNVPPFWVALEAAGFEGFANGSIKGALVLLGFAVILSWRGMMLMFPLGAAGRRGFVELGLVHAIVQFALLFPVLFWAAKPLSATGAWWLAGLLWAWTVSEAAFVVRELAIAWRRRGISGSWVQVNMAVWLFGLVFCLRFEAWLSGFLSCPRSISLPLCLVLMPLASPLGSSRMLGNNRHEP